MKGYLGYYKKIKSIPTVNLSDLSTREIFKQRFNFYFKIGISKKDFENKNILELCPGTGYNAYYLLKECKIKNIKLVEKNPYSLQKLKKNISDFKNAKIIDSNAFHFNTSEKYDYTILENTIGGFNLKQANSVFRKLKKFTKREGTIIMTFPNIYGLFSIKLKYLYAIMLVQKNKIQSFDNKIKYLTKIFNPHMKYLSNNARKTKNWILDMILFEKYIRKTKYFDIFELKKKIKDDFLVKSVSPSFYVDYIWYKNLTTKKYNSNIFNQVSKNQINFLDFETRFTSHEKNIDSSIKKITQLISDFSFEKKISLKKIDQISIEINKMIRILKKINKKNKVTHALSEILGIIHNYQKNKKIPEKTKHISKFWGIASTVVSLYKI